MNRLGPLVFFLICGVIDFVWGCIKWHSVSAGLVAIVAGLPLTAVLYFLFSAFGKGNDDSDAPRT
jgi:hypothetical protein